MTWVVEVLRALKITMGETHRGRVWILCPWHQPSDAPASWATSCFVRTAGTRRDRSGREYSAVGQFKCFACGEGGAFRDLVMRVRRCTEEEARAFVRARGAPAGAKVEQVQRRVVVVRREPRGLVRFTLPREVIFEPLDRWVSPAREEIERRGITAEEVVRYGIGYAVDGSKLGGRIVIPWKDSEGRVGSYTARTFVGAEPKYTTPHPDEHPLRSVIFGEHLWSLRRDVVLVTEGAFNAIAVARAIPDACVAAIGGATNYTEGHAAKLATFARVLVLTDPDEAGDRAANRIALTLGRYSRVDRVRLPDGCDAEDVGSDHLRAVVSRVLAAAS